MLKSRGPHSLAKLFIGNQLTDSLSKHLFIIDRDKEAIVSFRDNGTGAIRAGIGYNGKATGQCFYNDKGKPFVP